MMCGRDNVRWETEPKMVCRRKSVRETKCLCLREREIRI